MTPWSDIIVDNAMVFIKDIRMQKELDENPAQFFRKMSLYVQNAVPELNRPPQLLQYIQSGMIQPEFTDFEWKSTPESVIQQTQVETGMFGFDICSCTSRKHTKNGGMEIAPYAGFSYDRETGVVTFDVQDSADIEYDLDFYKDGQFPDLTIAQRRLFGMAIAIVWDDSNARTWLDMAPKINDKSFNTGSTANHTKSQTERIVVTHSDFNGAMHKYEQDCAHAGVVSAMRRQSIPLL